MIYNRRKRNRSQELVTKRPSAILNPLVYTLKSNNRSKSYFTAFYGYYINLSNRKKKVYLGYSFINVFHNLERKKASLFGPFEDADVDVE